MTTRSRLTFLVIAYTIVAAVMAGPLVNYSALQSATYQGDARLIVWTLAWDNHAVLSRLPLFDCNIFYPAAHTLAYNEHLFGLSLFTLPLYALTRNPVLAYNIIWWLSFPLNLLAMHALLRRHVHDDVAAAAGALVYTFSFYKMLPEMGPPETTIFEYARGDESWALETRAFGDDIRLNREPSPGLAEGIRTLEIVEQIYRQSGFKVPVAGL